MPRDFEVSTPERFAQKVVVHFVRGSGRRENSPAIYRWGSVGQSIQSARRTAERQI